MTSIQNTKLNWSVKVTKHQGVRLEFLHKRGTVMIILLLSRQNCSEIMTQNLCSKQETLLQPQEEDIKRFSKGEIFTTHNDKT